MGNIYQLAPKNLQEHLDALTIFSQQLNKRPSHELWYSEKLITQNQKYDYENAIKAFQDFIDRIEASQIPKNGQTSAFKT